MKILKIILSTLVLIGIFALVWYLFFKEYDYQVHFKTRYGPSAVYYDFMDSKSLNGNQVFSSVKYSEIVQKRTVKDSLFKFKWNFDQATDSTTQITVQVKNESTPLAVRLDVLNPFSNAYEDQLKSYFTEYNQLLSALQKNYHVSSTVEKTNFDGRYCICTSGKDVVSNKAKNMMGQLDILNRFFENNKIKPNGDPLLIAHDWNRETDTVQFDFCFPLMKNDSSKLIADTHFKILKDLKGYQSTFKGNYRLSHRAWAQIRLLLEERKLNFSDTLIEVYHNSPMVDSNSENWKASVFIPSEK